MARRSFIFNGTVISVAAGLLVGLYLLSALSLPEKYLSLFLLALFSFLVFMIVGNVRRLLLAIILVELPFQLDIYLNYREEFANLGAIGGLNISVTSLSLAVLYALWIHERLMHGGISSHSLFRLSLPPLAYLAIVTLSSLVAKDIILAINEIFLLLQAFLLYLYIIKSVRTREDVFFIITVLFIGLILESLIMIALRITGNSVSIANIFARIDNSSRVGGTVGSPITAASYLCLLLAPALSIFITRLRTSYRAMAAIAFGLGGAALIFTLSRGGWISFAFSVVILCWFSWRRGWLSPSLPIIMGMVVLVLIFFFKDTVVTRLLGDDTGSAYSRIPLIKIAFKIILDNPVLGVGASNCALWIEQYATGREWLYSIHNKYLLVWVETGFFGLLTFIGFLLTVIRRGWQTWQFRDPFLSPLALGFTAAIVGQMTHMLADVFNSRPQVQMLWLIAGLITAIRNIVGDHKLC